MEFISPCVFDSAVLEGYIFEGLPHVREVWDAIYLPKNPFHDQGFFGVYDKFGRLVNECSMYWGRQNALAEQSNLCSLPIADELEEIESAVYCGYVGLHYGHTILDFVARTWWTRDNPGLPRKILIHSHHSLDRLFSTRWFVDLVGYIGLERSDFILLDVPVRVKRLFAPNPGCEADSYCYRGFMQYCNELGRIATQGVESPSQPVYLTRRYLSGGSLCFENEGILADAMSERGFREVAPEHLTLAEQIAIFRGRQPIAGIAGSSFHTSVYAPAPRAVGLQFGVQITDTFYVFDAANDARIDYVHPRELQRIFPSKPGFPVTMSMGNPLGVAHDLAERAFEIARAKPDHNSETLRPQPAPVPDATALTFYHLTDHHGHPIKVMKHNGTIVSERTRGNDVLTCDLLLFRGADGRCFLVSDNSILIPLHYPAARIGRLLTEVAVQTVSDGVVTIRGQNGRWLWSGRGESRIGLDFSAPVADLWEQYTLTRAQDVRVDRKRLVQALERAMPAQFAEPV